MDNAAIGGLTSIFCKTKKTGNEWCGNIFLNSKGQYRLSGPFEGGKSLCGKQAPVHSDERMVGYYHSHPQGESLDFESGLIIRPGAGEPDWYKGHSGGRFAKDHLLLDQQRRGDEEIRSSSRSGHRGRPHDGTRENRYEVLVTENTAELRNEVDLTGLQRRADKQ
jgi:hypothetical protein